MKHFFIFLFMLISTAIFAQNDVNIFNTQLQSGQAFSFNENAVCFKEVVSDSRCPKGVTCVWAGEARVLVDIYEDGKFKEEKMLIINGNNISINFSFGDKEYAISAPQLYPYPAANATISKGDYILDLQISEKLKSK